jgi:hypothetical protein
MSKHNILAIFSNHTYDSIKYNISFNNISYIIPHVSDIIIVDSIEEEYAIKLKTDLTNISKIKNFYFVKNDKILLDFYKWMYILNISNKLIEKYDYILFINDSIIITHDMNEYFNYLNNSKNKITLLKELCKIEQKQNTKLTQEDGTKLYTTITNILRDNSIDTETIKLVFNLYYYLYIETLNNLLKDDIGDSDYTEDSVMNDVKTLQLNTLANIFEKMGNQPVLQTKYRTAYINRLTAQDKDSYTKEVNNTADAATAAEKAEKWELAHILHERAHRYAVVYFGLDDTTFTPVIGTKKTEFLERKGKATNDLTMTIKSLYKQLSMGKPGTGEPEAAFTTFYNNYVSFPENRGFNPNTIEEQSKTAIKSILASVTKDETGVDFFRNMNKDIKVEDMNIYDLLMILIKNIILCLNVYLIVSSKIYRNQPDSPSIIVTYFQDLNLYYGFKQSYNKLMTALNNNRNNRSVNIESGPEDIVRNNSAFTNMLLITLGATLGLSGLTIATSGGSSSSSNSKKKKNTKKRQYKRDKKNKNSKVSRKLRRK